MVCPHRSPTKAQIAEAAFANIHPPPTITYNPHQNLSKGRKWSDVMNWGFFLFHVCLLFSCGEAGISMHSGKKANGLCAALGNVQLRSLGTFGTYHPLTHCTYALSWKWCFQMVVGSFNNKNKLQRFFRNGGSWEFVDYHMSFWYLYVKYKAQRRNCCCGVAVYISMHM